MTLFAKLTAGLVCAGLVHVAASGPVQMSAAKTDIPLTTDMSSADPKSWHTLPPFRKEDRVRPWNQWELASGKDSRSRTF